MYWRSFVIINNPDSHPCQGACQCYEPIVITRNQDGRYKRITTLVSENQINT